MAPLKSSRFPSVLILLLALLCILVPLVLANDRKGLLEGFFAIVLLFFFPGYAFQSALGTPRGALRIFLSPVFGIAAVVTGYDLAARLSMGNYYPYLVLLSHVRERGCSFVSSDEHRCLISGNLRMWRRSLLAVLSQSVWLFCTGEADASPMADLCSTARRGRIRYST